MLFFHWFSHAVSRLRFCSISSLLPEDVNFIVKTIVLVEPAQSDIDNEKNQEISIQWNIQSLIKGFHLQWESLMSWGIESLSQAPSTRIRIFLKTQNYLYVSAFLPHVAGVFGDRKRNFLKTLFRVEIFEKAGFTIVSTDGENAISRKWWRHALDLTLWTQFFSKTTGKKFRVFKISVYVWT